MPIILSSVKTNVTYCSFLLYWKVNFVSTFNTSPVRDRVQSHCKEKQSLRGIKCIQEIKCSGFESFCEGTVKDKTYSSQKVADSYCAKVLGYFLLRLRLRKNYIVVEVSQCQKKVCVALLNMALTLSIFPQAVSLFSSPSFFCTSPLRLLVLPDTNVRCHVIVRIIIPRPVGTFNMIPIRRRTCLWDYCSIPLSTIYLIKWDFS